MNEQCPHLPLAAGPCRECALLARVAELEAENRRIMGLLAKAGPPLSSAEIREQLEVEAQTDE